MAHPIPLSVPDITQAEIDAVVDLLRTGAFTGERISEFEQACANACNRRNAIAVSSGTAALHCALLACGVESDHEVITSPFCFVATANSIINAGGKPVFVDIHPKTLNLDVDKIEAAISPKTRAILAVEALGHPGSMDEIEQIARRHELILLENACEAFGAKRSGRPVGSYGRASCLSFHAHKQITTGEGGMILTDDERLADQCRSLRDHGRDGTIRPEHSRMGYSYRMCEMSAALGLAQFKRLPELTEKRRQVVRGYFERLIESRYTILPTVPEEVTMSWCVFVVRLNDLFEPGDRDEIVRLMKADGIECGRHFPPVHLQSHIASRLGTRRGDFPVCEYISERTLALPLHSRLSTEDVARVCASLDKAIEQVLMGRTQSRFN